MALVGLMLQINKRTSSIVQVVNHILLFHPGSFCLIAFGYCLFFASGLFLSCLTETMTSPLNLVVVYHSPFLSTFVNILLLLEFLWVCVLVFSMIASIILVMRMRTRPCLCGRIVSEINYSKGPKLILFLNIWLFLLVFEFFTTLVLNLSGGRAGWSAVLYLWFFWSAFGALPFLLAAKSRLCLNFERDIRLVTDQQLLAAQLEKMSESTLIGLAEFSADFGEHINASIIKDQLASRANSQIVGKSEEELQYMLKMALQDKNAPKADLISKSLMVGTEDEVCN